MDDAGLRYAYKPSLAGAACELELAADALRWQIGHRSGRIPYGRVRSVRMAFRPASMQARRFVTEIRADGNPKIRIVSVSWVSLTHQQRLDREYRDFVVELHRRLAAAGSNARLAAGLPALPYGIGVMLFAAVMIAIAVLTLRALQAGQGGAAAVVGLFFVIFAVQLGEFFYRNRPQTYRPEALPETVLPRRREDR